MWSRDGVRLAVTDRGPDGPDLRVFLSHATGFCGAVWRPVAEALGPDLSITSWDFRGHGRSAPIPIPLSFWELAGDVAAVRDSTPSARSVGVGHSMGGATLLMAQIEQPDRFSALVLVEPIIIPPPFRRTVHAMSRMAAKRRASFADLEAARSNFTGKPPFAGWHPAAFDGYVEDGLIERREGGVTLACSPQVEAEIYTAASAHGLAALLDQVEIPVVLLVGSETDTYPVEWVEEVASRLPKGRIEVIDGADHFLPMTDPDLVASKVESELRRLR